MPVVTHDHVGPFHTNGELGALFASGVTIFITALVLLIGVVSYCAIYTVNCQSEQGTALMIGALWAGAAGCMAASAFRTVAAAAIASTVAMAVMFVAGQWMVHAAFLIDCSPHQHWFLPT